MADWMMSYADDYTDLGFDVVRHKEAFRRFAELDIHPRSVRAILTAREILVFSHPSDRFSIGCAVDLANWRVETAEGDCINLFALYHSQDTADVNLVQNDVIRYFQRHFPGRCLKQDESTPLAENAHWVAIALYAPTEASELAAEQ